MQFDRFLSGSLAENYSCRQPLISRRSTAVLLTSFRLWYNRQPPSISPSLYRLFVIISECYEFHFSVSYFDLSGVILFSFSKEKETEKLPSGQMFSSYTIKIRNKVTWLVCWNRLFVDYRFVFRSTCFEMLHRFTETSSLIAVRCGWIITRVSFHLKDGQRSRWKFRSKDIEASFVCARCKKYICKRYFILKVHSESEIWMKFHFKNEFLTYIFLTYKWTYHFQYT